SLYEISARRMWRPVQWNAESDVVEEAAPFDRCREATGRVRRRQWVDAGNSLIGKRRPAHKHPEWRCCAVIVRTDGIEINRITGTGIGRGGRECSWRRWGGEIRRHRHIEAQIRRIPHRVAPHHFGGGDGIRTRFGCSLFLERPGHVYDAQWEKREH